MTHVDPERLSPRHRSFVAKALKASERNQKPREPRPTMFGEEFDSKLELEFAIYLEALRTRGDIDEWMYHPLKFRIAKCATYEPDFLLRKGSQFRVIEVKGSWKAKNARDSHTRLEVAAYLYQWFSWYSVVKDKGEWQFKQVHATQAEVGPMD